MKPHIRLRPPARFIVLALFCLSAVSCSTRMPSDAEIERQMDSTMIHPMNPDAEDVSDSAQDSLKTDTVVMDAPR